MILVKLGGSIITNKAIYKEFREETVRKIVERLPKEDLTIVHGAGSFGHILVDKYKLTEGDLNKKSEFAQVEIDMLELNLKILKILHENGIPGVSIPPHANDSIEIFKKYVSSGFIPVTFGDVVVDDKIRIISGDDLMLKLAEEFHPEKTIFITDVDGIFDKNPKEPNAKLIKILDRNFNPKTALNVIDVTGGISHKIEIMRKIAEVSEVYVINGNYPERISAVIEGKEFVGTIVK